MRSATTSHRLPLPLSLSLHLPHHHHHHPTSHRGAVPEWVFAVVLVVVVVMVFEWDVRG